MGSVLKPHLQAQLQRDIDAIRSKLLEMVSLDEQALTRAFHALRDRDRQLAYSVILRDRDVDALDAELDKLCLEFIVRHQPVAGDLRFVYGASKVVSQLERVGDYAESIARQVLLLSSVHFEFPIGRFSEIANLAIPMVHNAVRAFVDCNADLAHATMQVEPRVNLVRDKLSAEILAAQGEGCIPLEALTPLIAVARRYERVSDQATNICEEALYYATGEYMRHMPQAEFQVVFLDEAHGCLSRMAEAIAGSLGARRFVFTSAGLVAGAADPQAVWFLSQKGLDISRQQPRSVDQVLQLDSVQIVVSLSKEAESAVGKWPPKVLNLRWLVPDPSKVRGAPEEVLQAYEQSFELLRTHIKDLVKAVEWEHKNGGEEASAKD